MFSKITPLINKYYFAPVGFLVPITTLRGTYDEYVKNNNRDSSLIEHTFGCLMGAWVGILSGVFLGVAWPISLPIFIGRCIYKK